MKKPTKTQKNKKKGALSLMLLLSSLISIVSVYSLPQIQLISQADPLEYRQIQTLTLTITSSTPNTTITEALIEFEQQNHTLQKENQYYIYSWIPATKGLNTYTIYAEDSANETKTYTNTFQIQDTTPPEITEVQPQGNLNYNLIELKAVTNENSTCKYDEVDVSYDSMYFSLSGDSLTHTKLRSFGDGETILYVRCKDSENNIGQKAIIRFKIDTTPPQIYGITPTGTATQEQITLRLNTDEQATCKWGKTDNEYDSLTNQFQTTGGNLHEQPLNLAEGINTYYISCKDSTGNKDPIITINIELNLPPTASISIQKNQSYNALAQGTYIVSLSASESLSPAPTLKLRYSNQLINIPLEGSSQTWKGYLIIPPDSGENVGEFQYSGTDIRGTTGTEITHGKLVIIDTSPPPAPTSLKLTNENNKIRLSWDYTGEETDHYNIYRSTTGSTDKSNLKTRPEERTFTDSDVINKIGYFYRISAVDNAGNEGPLSEEDFIMTEYQNATDKFQQKPELLAIINNKISQLEILVNNLEVKIVKLEQTTDQDLLQIINEQEIARKLKETKSNLQTLIGELKTYKETPITEEELKTKIELIDTKLATHKKEIVKEIKINNKVQNEQIPDENLMQKVAEEYLKNKILTDEQRRNYYEKTRELQEEVRILQTIINYDIEYEYKESEKITLLKETLLTTRELKGVLLQEIIPKDVIKISEITFTVLPYELNQMGAVWLLKDLDNNQVTYKTTSQKENSQLQRIRTIVFYDIDQFLSDIASEKTNASNGITGQSIVKKQGISLNEKLLISLAIIVVITLLTYYFAFLKTEKTYAKEIIAEEKEKEKAALIGINFPSELSSIQEKKQEIFANKEINRILSFVRQAYEDLKAEKISSAYENYNLALSTYLESRLDFKERLKANFEMNSLREKIIEASKTKDLYS